MRGLVALTLESGRSPDWWLDQGDRVIQTAFSLLSSEPDDDKHPGGDMPPLSG